MMSGFRAAASLKVTLVGSVILALGLVADQNDWLPGAWAITPPLALLTVNLAAALAVDRRFRRQPALFGFHLCLLMLAVLAGLAQLTEFQARLVLLEGQPFAGDLLEPVSAGPLAPAPPPKMALHQGPVEVDYSPELRRGRTRSHLRLQERGWLEIGDDRPLISEGFRFYTTSNKGFALLVHWVPEHGSPEFGAIRFPSFPLNELGQVARWRVPGGDEVEFFLSLPPVPYDDRWTLSTALAKRATVGLKTGNRQLTLRQGEDVSLQDGKLRMQRIAMWMGYEVRYAPTLPWLFSMAALAVLLLAAHFVLRLSAPAGGAEPLGDRVPT